MSAEFSRMLILQCTDFGNMAYKCIPHTPELKNNILLNDMHCFLNAVLSATRTTKGQRHWVS